MTELIQVQTTNLQPAVVEFNYDAISAHLDGVLQMYKGLVFTEKEVGECKKTIAELRKGKKALDEFRKHTKRELTESITDFENRCKELGKKFDAVITPLTEQYEQFEHDRRERKRVEMKSIADALIAEQGLNENYADQLLDFPAEYFNKGKSLKDIKAELTARAESLGIAQDKEDADREIIKTKVELANARYGVNLIETPYVNLLQHEYTIDAIVEKINADAETLKKRAENVESPAPAAPPVPPAASAALKSSPAAEKYIEKYEVTGTEEQLVALENYLQLNAYAWKIID